MNYTRQKGRFFRTFAALTVPFLLMLSAQSALGQGFKMTQLEVPGNQANYHGPCCRKRKRSRCRLRHGIVGG